MLTVMEAIQKRRSIRQFKPDPVPEEMINQMLEAARLAPSGGNRQPWRFQVITDQGLKERLFKEASFDVEYIAKAPVVIACGSELLTFAQEHGPGEADSEPAGAGDVNPEDLNQFKADAHLYTGIAVEHMVLTGTALGLGTCWVQRIRYGGVAKILGWPRHIVVLALLLVGYPDEDPEPRERLPLEDIIIKEGKFAQ